MSFSNARERAEHRVLSEPIVGALGTQSIHESGTRRSFAAHLKTLGAIVGPGIIVMVGDNDAGAFGTYAQAGHDYGTRLLWTLLLLVPVLYVNQEMVLRLGAVTGVGHAMLIKKRFGSFWAAFSIFDLLVLDALTIVTEFIGIEIGLAYFGVPKVFGVVGAGVLVAAGALQGNFRRFERFCLILCAGSLALVPVVLAVHTDAGTTLHDLVVPGLPHGTLTSDVALLVCAIVGTTIAPWQLFFQQSYVIDKRITARFIAYERIDLAIGIAIVLAGAVAIVTISAAAYGPHVSGAFTDAGSVASAVKHRAGSWLGACFALALIDASIIGAASVGLATAYAIGDVFSLQHSLHSKPAQAPVFYGTFVFSILPAAALVLVPNVPLGLLTNGVQVLAGILLPSATVFLLLLCNDRAVLGPWTNGVAINVFAAIVIAALLALSIVLTASTFFPEFGTRQIIATLAIGLIAAIFAGCAYGRRTRATKDHTEFEKAAWRMPPLDTLAPLRLGRLEKAWLFALRAYLGVALVFAIVKIASLVAGHA